MIRKKVGLYFISALTIFMLAGPAGVSFAATGLKLNPALDYTSDSNDGPLITGEGLSDGSVRKGTPAYIIFYHRECYNSKRQARRTVELYDKYKDNADFIIVDLDTELSKEQEGLRSRFYRNYIPHVTVIDAGGKVVYDKSGEVGTDVISAMLDRAL
ncbi:MAG: TlpA family protein disulfide reductase [Thermodesulfobacteriota bacterium]